MDCKKILFGTDAKKGIKDGIDMVANAVKVTLGYGGRTVIISETGFSSRTTKDGVTVANHIKLRDPLLDAGAKMIKEASSKTADVVGDGTTTVCVLIQSLVEEGMKLIEKGANPMEIKRGMEYAAQKVVEMIKTVSKPADDRLLEAVATISANNDEDLGKLIGDAYKKIGKHGTLTIDDSHGPDTHVELINGYQFISGFHNPLFINRPDNNSCELNDVCVLMAEHKISKVEDILPIMEAVAKNKKTLVIIAEGFDSSVIATCLRNRDNFGSVLIPYNFTGDTKLELMHDLLAVTGATLVESKGDLLQNIKADYLGYCNKIISKKDETIIIGGKVNQEKLKARIIDAEAKIKEATHPAIRGRQEARIAKLNGCVGVIYVGGNTEVEVSEKKDRVDDSIKATKAALEEGVVPGGGITLYKLTYDLLPVVYEDLKDENNNDIPETDFFRGVEIVINAMKAPSIQIMQNRGDSRDIRSLVDIHSKFENGINARTGRIEDLVSSGVVDPAKVVRICIENAVSAAAQILISEALIISDN